MATGTTSSLGTLEALSGLLDYPDEGYAERAARAEAAIRERSPAVADALGAFFRAVEATPLTALEERFTRTFDWSPERCLEIGWHLYGENYDRGAFLVQMRDLLRHAGLDESGELPDHLGRLLLAVARLPADDTEPLVRERLIPALEKIRAGFKDDDNPFADVVRATHIALAERCQGV
ncbi:MAG: nitrate reductase molybdenum cofactor assembly chaperone [Planctomycetota bacterium]|jgi:nitrate reductase delta subunit